MAVRPSEVVAGIIPARAGFTCRTGATPVPSADHPRSRGVYGVDGDDAIYFLGSSPLARGLPTAPSTPSRRSRIIPARAGFTHTPITYSPDGPDHPRSRGVYLSSLAPKTNMCGSSPLARGLRRPRRGERRDPRIIPARAGFTNPSCSGAAASPDHPRSRGVYTTRRMTDSSGSWIIPARAGFTPPIPGASR